MEGLDKAGQDFCHDMWVKYEPAILRLCQYKLQSCSDEIDDVIADTFLCLCKAVFNEVEIRYPGAWIFAVANNLIKSKYAEINRSRRRKVNFDEDTIELYDLYVEYDFDQREVSDEEIDAGASDIKAQFNRMESEILKLIYDDKLKMREVAEVMNLTEAAVKQRHYRLRKKVSWMAKEYAKKLV